MLQQSLSKTLPFAPLMRHVANDLRKTLPLAYIRVDEQAAGYFLALRIRHKDHTRGTDKANHKRGNDTCGWINYPNQTRNP
jgi:hypothetical protein